jgi:outer membrane protein assembly factor BamE (lipoprotein component of BamABCDE complex)
MRCLSEPSPPVSKRRFRRIAAITCLTLSLPLGACSFFQAQSATRGDPIDGLALKQLVPGTTTEADATALLGSPTAHETFDDNAWVYISQITRPQVGRLPAVLRQRVVVLDFNQTGVLQKVKVYDKADGKNISMAPGTTKSPGSNASLLQQLFGNIGRFSGGTAGGTGLGGGAPGGG